MPAADAARSYARSTVVAAWRSLAVRPGGAVALGVALSATPVGATWWADLQVALSDLFDWIQGLFT